MLKCFINQIQLEFCSPAKVVTNLKTKSRTGFAPWPKQPSSLDARIAKQYKSCHISSRSSGSLRFRKAVQSYNKIAAMLFMCYGIIMQLSEAFSHFARCKSKRLIGNSRIASVDGGVWWCYLLDVYFLFECRTSLWKFRHRI